MKKSLIAFAILAASATVAFVSCKKDKDDSGSNNNTQPKTKTELLTGPNWQPTDVKVGGNSVWSLVDDCDKDNFYKFNTGGAGTLDDGATKCSAGDPQTTSFQWKFLNNETQLVFDGDTANIDELTETNMKLSSDTDLGKAELFFSKK